MRRSVGLNNHRSEHLTELGFLKFVNLTNFILKICEYLSTATHLRGEILRFFLLQVSSKLGVWPNLLFLTHLMSSAETPGFLISSQVSKGQLTRAGGGRWQGCVNHFDRSIVQAVNCRIFRIHNHDLTIFQKNFYLYFISLDARL